MGRQIAPRSSARSSPRRSASVNTGAAVSQSVRELEWKQAEMARTLVNGMMADEGWQAMTMLDWEEGRDYELAPGTKVHILPRDVPVAIEASLRANGPQAHGDTTIHHGPIRPLSVHGESAAGGGTLGPGTNGRCTVSARVVRRETDLSTQEAASCVHGRELHDRVEAILRVSRSLAEVSVTCPSSRYTDSQRSSGPGSR